MTDQNYFNTLVTTPETQESIDRLDGLRDTAEDLRQTMPEYVGMTAFGSTVRGEARPDSDVDIFVYIDESDDAPIQASSGIDKESRVITLGEADLTPGSTAFNPFIGIEYKYVIGKKLVEHDIPEADIIAIPISKEIVEQQTSLALDAAKAFDVDGINNGAVAPRNIRGLFHVGIDTDDLSPYIKQVVDTYAQSPHGETAWSMLRHVVASFEVGREGDTKNVTHRYLPKTIKEAQEYYDSSL